MLLRLSRIYWDDLQAQGMKIPWSKPTFVSAVDVAQRRGRVARAQCSSGRFNARTYPTVSS